MTTGRAALSLSALSSGGKAAVLGTVFSSVRLLTHAVGESSEQVWWQCCMGVGRKERFSSSPEASHVAVTSRLRELFEALFRFIVTPCTSIGENEQHKSAL